ncbi:MAG: leucyl aminopeptidase [Candidatus Competibacterales bacterium]
MDIHFTTPDAPATAALVVGAFAEGQLSPAAQTLDRQSHGQLQAALAAHPRFVGKAEQFIDTLVPRGEDFLKVVVVGLGEPDAVDENRLIRTGGAVVAHLDKVGVRGGYLDLDGFAAAQSPTAAAALAYGARLRHYRFDRHKSRQEDDQQPLLESLTIATADPAAATVAFAPLEAVAEGVHMARDLAAEPANVLYPASYAERCRELLEPLGATVEILDATALAELGAGALLAVGQGSAREPRLVVMEWRGGPPDAPPLAFVGKGVTFDTGGISIKPAAGMEDMKWDMAGSAAVVGAMYALAKRRAQVNTVGVIGLVENMPSGTAMRPGDVVTSLSGKTIEVLNTDAEGRLVLADALWYVQQRFKPRWMVDLATLTGAIIVSLGRHKAGLFANDDDLGDALQEASRATGEALWPMPLGEEYDREMNSDIADVKNISGDRFGGAITAAAFLQRFVNDTPWAHLDIAGTAWGKKDSPTGPKGATGFGVRLLERLAATAEDTPDTPDTPPKAPTS